MTSVNPEFVLNRTILRPKPSLKRSENGRPPAHGWWYAVHFHRPSAGVLPSSPALREPVA